MLFAEIRQNRRIRRIRQNHRFVGTPISSSIALWRNFVKIAILTEFRRIRQNRRFAGTPILSSIDLRQSRQNHQSRRILRIRQNRRFVGTPMSSSIALRRNLSKSPFSPNLPDSSKSPFRQYPYLELNRSLAKFHQNPYLELNRSLAIFHQNHHSRRIRQNCHIVGTPISSSIALW